MRFISPKLICRFSSPLITAALCLAGVNARAGQDLNSLVGTGDVNSAHTSNISEGGKAPEARLKIGPGDLIEVNVLDEDDLKQTVRLNDLGDGTLSYIGSLHLAGLTTDQAASLIARRLKEGNYLLAPQVGVIIREYSTQGVSVLGGGKNAGGLRSNGGPDVVGCPCGRGGNNSPGRS